MLPPHVLPISQAVPSTWLLKSKRLVFLIASFDALMDNPGGVGSLVVSIDKRTYTRNKQGSAIDSSSNYVRCNLLKLLTIVAESGPSGFESVTNALDHVKVRSVQQ